jgi:hypothetical protein
VHDVPVLRRLICALALAFVAVVAIPATTADAGPSVDVYNFGDAPALGAPDTALNGRIVDLAAHPTKNGYWLLGRDGGVFSYNVNFYGSTGGLPLNKPVVGMAATKSGNGYWFVAEDGGVFSYGDAKFYGSTGAIALNSPIVDMAVTPTGKGYWLLAADGGVFSFGDAMFHGSLGGTGATVVAMTAHSNGTYTLLHADGRLTFFIAGNGQPVPGTVPTFAVDVAAGKNGGYFVLGADGGVFAYGAAVFRGAAIGTGRIGAALARTASGGGYWVAMIPRPAEGPPVPTGSGSGRRIVYSNSMQRVWLVEQDETPSHSFLVSGRRGVPSPGTYHVFSKSVMSSAHGGDLRLPYMTRFAHGSSLAIGFHGIPLRRNGTPIQSDAELGEYRSAGCVRMNQGNVKTLFDWAPVGTTVVVLP